MTRISSNSFHDATIRNIQNSFEELTRLQSQLQTQKLLSRPSEDPVIANQAIRIERNLHEIQQYNKNVQSGSEYLIYSDQILSQIDASINTAIEKSGQGLNAEMTSTALQAIGQEIQEVLKQIVSIGNSTLGDKSIFGGSDFKGQAFEFIGNDVLFNGNSDTFDISVFGSERIQANITADQAFGARGTILDSEKDLAPGLSSLSIRKDIEIDSTKIINQNVLKVTARQSAINMYAAAGASTAEQGLFVTALDAKLALVTTFTDNQSFADAVRDATATGFGAADANSLTRAQTVIATKTVDAANNIFKDSTNNLVFKEGDHSDTARLHLTLTATNTTDMGTLVSAINDGVGTVAGKDGTGTIDNSNIKINAKLAIVRAFSDAGAISTADIGAQVNTINTASTTATTSQSYAVQVRAGAFTALGVTEATASVDQLAQATAAERAARNTWASIEFQASKTRQGLVITHKLGDQVSVDTGASNKTTVNDLELNGRVNVKNYIYNKTPVVANLAADRIMTLTASNGNFLKVTLRAGDSTSVIAKRINEAINATDVDESLRSIVANTKTVSTTSTSLEIVSDEFFQVSMDNTAEYASETALSYTALKGSKNSIDDLRAGIGIRTANSKIMADNTTTGFTSNVHVRAGDSLDYIIDQLNNLKGFEVGYNTQNTGIDLYNTSRYSTNLTPADASTIATKVFTITADNGGIKTVTFAAATNTLSEMAEEINALSSTVFRFNAEVNSTGSGLVISSNEKFSLNLAEAVPIAISSSALSDHTDDNLITSTLLSGLGLSETLSTTGSISGQNIIHEQVRLSDLNNGEGVSKGSLRFTINNVTTDVDLSSASTLRDVKVLIEKGLSNTVEVKLNSANNGLAINSTSSSSIRIQELNNGSIGRQLGIIPAPNNSVSGTAIQGTAINPIFNGETLLKDLNNGNGVDSTGFVIQNGSNKTTITFDTDGDGLNDIRTVQEMVNHINQKSKQDDVYIEASIDPTTSKIKIVSKLSNTSLQINENPVEYDTYISKGIPANSTSTLTLTSSDGTKSPITIDLTGSTSASEIVTKINTAAALTTSKFSFKGRVADDGTVEIVSNENLNVNDTTVSYRTEQFTPNPPVIGTTASDLGLLGAFSNKTLLTSLNQGNGIEHGQFNIKYGSTTNANHFVDAIVPVVGEKISFFNENGSISNSYTFGTTDVATEIAAMNLTIINTGMGITAKASTTTGLYVSSNSKFSITNDTTSTTKYVAQFEDVSLSTAAKSISIDLEFGETLEDIKNAIETASNNEVLVSFGKANRIELRLASGDTTQRIEITELNGSSNVAGSLGLTSSSIVKGREIKSGITDTLTAATKLSEIGLDINLSAAANSTENNLVFLIGTDTISIDLTSANTIGDVVSKINQVTQNDNGGTISLQAKINQGKYLSVQNMGGSELIVQRSGFSDSAERLGLIPDPTLTDDITFYGEDLNPMHQANNFFSALTIMRDQLLSGKVDVSIFTAARVQLENVQDQYLGARAASGSRISRFEALKTRYEEEEVNLQAMFGTKSTIDIIEVTQKFLAQQQIYEAGLSTASRILGTSLFSFI